MTGINLLVLHHSGGRHEPNALDLKSYHRVVTGAGVVLDGQFPISANALGRRLASGTYAAHTANLNSGSIGLAMACMRDGQWSSPRACPDFPTPSQVKAFIGEAARLCVKYSTPITRRTVLTHAEVEITLGVKQKNKWDFDYDPFAVIDSRDPIVIGDMLRDRISSAILAQRGDGLPVSPTAPADRPLLRRGSTGVFVREAQDLLGIASDGAFGPKTFGTVLAFQKARQMHADGIIGPATWGALLKGQ